MPVNVKDDEDQHSGEEDDVVPTLQDEDDEDEDFNHYTLRLASTITIASEIICLAFSEDGRYLLACCGDGVVRVFNPSSGRLVSVLVSKRDNATDHSATTKQGRRSRRASSILDCVELPCTCASFRPYVKAAVDNGEQSASYDEKEEFYTKKSRVSRQMDDNALDPVDTEVLCCAYACTGQVFALGLSDGVVKVYDDNTKEKKLNEVMERVTEIEQRSASLEQDARQLRLAMEADVPSDTEICERPEGAAAAVQAKHGDRFSANQVDPDPTRLTSFGDDSVEPPALFRSWNDALVGNGAAVPKSFFSPSKMRTSTAAGGLLPAGKASPRTTTVSGG